jgi:hypothetical protein
MGGGQIEESNVETELDTIRPSTSRAQSASLPVVSQSSENPLSVDVPAMKKKVLVVEDNIINQTVLKRQLVKAGYACEGKCDGKKMC